VPYRAGRVDATGPITTQYTVPQPQDSLASHTAAFARMNFSATEMIQLVACGHTLGGVQQFLHEDVIPPTSNAGEIVFDSWSYAIYDNQM
jgi:catalase (peroxidase I)